jgi:hypothetical protein
MARLAMGARRATSSSSCTARLAIGYLTHLTLPSPTISGQVTSVSTVEAFTYFQMARRAMTSLIISRYIPQTTKSCQVTRFSAHKTSTLASSLLAKSADMSPFITKITDPIGMAIVTSSIPVFWYSQNTD